MKKILSNNDFYPEQQLPLDLVISPAFLLSTMRTVLDLEQVAIHRYSESGLFKPISMKATTGNATKTYRLFSLTDLVVGGLLKTLHSQGFRPEVAVSVVRDSWQGVASWLSSAEKLAGREVEDYWSPSRFLVFGESSRTVGLLANEAPMHVAWETIQKDVFNPLMGRPAMFVAADMRTISRYTMERLVELRAAGTLASLTADGNGLKISADSRVVPVQQHKPHGSVMNTRSDIKPIQAAIVLNQMPFAVSENASL